MGHVLPVPLLKLLQDVDVLHLEDAIRDARIRQRLPKVGGPRLADELALCREDRRDHAVELLRRLGVLVAVVVLEDECLEGAIVRVAAVRQGVVDRAVELGGRVPPVRSERLQNTDLAPNVYTN